MSATESTSGVLASLLDFSFSSLITMKLIKALYVFGVGVSVIMGAIAIVSAFSTGFIAGIGSLIVTPIIVLISVVYLRVMCEMVAAFFGMADDIKSLARSQNSTT